MMVTRKITFDRFCHQVLIEIAIKQNTKGNQNDCTAGKRKGSVNRDESSNIFSKYRHRLFAGDHVGPAGADRGDIEDPPGVNSRPIKRPICFLF